MAGRFELERDVRNADARVEVEGEERLGSGASVMAGRLEWARDVRNADARVEVEGEERLGSGASVMAGRPEWARDVRNADVRVAEEGGRRLAGGASVRNADDGARGSDSGGTPEGASGAGSAPMNWSARRRAGGAGAAAMLAGIAALMVGAGAARADDVRNADEVGLSQGDKPWQRGVAAAAQKAAEREFLAGNALFERAEYAAAAARYRAALGSWAHPAIQFNLAVCLIHLERPIEAYDMVQASLRYGREGLPGHFDEATNYERLLRDRIATLEVTLPAERQGTTVTLDGEPLDGEGKVVRRVAPGRHALVARRAHFETWSKDLVLPPGEVTREVIVLRAPRTRTVRRWSATMPWWVVGAGGAAAAAGTAGLLLGNANLRAVNAEVTQQCPPPEGCRDGLPSGLASDRDRAELEQRIGVTLLAAGAATVATGVVLLVLNQPRQVLDTPAVTVTVRSDEIGIGWCHAF